MPINNKVLTAVEIAQHYSSARGSVELINEIVASGETDIESTEALAQNKEYLESILAKDFWTTEDLTPFTAAINA